MVVTLINHLIPIFWLYHSTCISLQAEEFQVSVQIMRDFLPQAEAELKFRALPDDEMAIVQLIEKHEVKCCFY